MATKSELELLKIQQKTEVSKREFWRTIIVSGAAVVVVAAVTAFGSVYVAYLQRESTLEVELIKIDADLVKSFSDQFLSEDIGTRIRAAHLIKSIAPSENIRARWTDYHSELTDLYSAIIEKGKAPGSNIQPLFKDPAFLKKYGGIGCRADGVGGCWANNPPFKLNPSSGTVVGNGMVKG